jgi:DNA-binding response OmpR family regulator
VTKTGSILIADDEHSFRRSTLELLRREGYECEAAGDTDEAIQMLQGRRFDLLIADVKMPGNSNSRIVRSAKQFAPGMPVIIVTGFPSVESAVEAIELPVLAYQVKPVDYEVFLQRIDAALSWRSPYRALTQIRDDLEKCVHELDALFSEAPQQAKTAADTAPHVPALTLHRLAACLAELLRLPTTQAAVGKAMSVCEAIECPHWHSHQQAFRDVIDVLKDVKRRFKSKELGELRERLERDLGIREQ